MATFDQGLAEHAGTLLVTGATGIGMNLSERSAYNEGLNVSNFRFPGVFLNPNATNFG